MNVLTYIRRLFRKTPEKQHLEYVKEYAVDLDANVEIETRRVAANLPLKERPAPDQLRPEATITFSQQGDLESYVKMLNVPSEVIEGWISAGVLLPEETRVAAKMIRLMQTNGRFSQN